MPVPKGYRRPVAIGRIETPKGEGVLRDNHNTLAESIILAQKLRQTVVVRMDGNDIVFEARPT